MKRRLLVLAAGVAVVAAFVAAGSASAAPPPIDSSWIQQCVTEGGASYITDGAVNVEDELDCEADDSILADPGESGFTVANLCIERKTYLYADDSATDAFLAALQDAGYSASAGACPASAQAAPPAGIFLCYSTYQTDPGVWPADVAAQLLKQGYWMPYAVPSTVTGGTNIGGYHLACNLAATQSVGDGYVGGDGTVLGPGYKGVPGLYPKIG